MPFPPGVLRASESRAARPLMDFKSQEIMLLKYAVRDAFTFKGQTAHLNCVSEDGEPIDLYTTSRVVIEQLEAIGESLPILITPQETKGYQTIY